MGAKFTRKELVAFISEQREDVVTIDQLRYNEKEWGLLPARGTDLNKRVVRYERSVAIRALIRRKVIPGTRVPPNGSPRKSRKS